MVLMLPPVTSSILRCGGAAAGSGMRTRAGCRDTLAEAGQDRTTQQPSQHHSPPCRRVVARPDALHARLRLQVGDQGAAGARQAGHGQGSAGSSSLRTTCCCAAAALDVTTVAARVRPSWQDKAQPVPHSPPGLVAHFAKVGQPPAQLQQHQHVLRRPGAQRGPTGCETGASGGCSGRVAWVEGSRAGRPLGPAPQVARTKLSKISVEGWWLRRAGGRATAQDHQGDIQRAHRPAARFHSRPCLPAGAASGGGQRPHMVTTTVRLVLATFWMARMTMAAARASSPLVGSSWEDKRRQRVSQA